METVDEGEPPSPADGASLGGMAPAAGQGDVVGGPAARNMKSVLLGVDNHEKGQKWQGYAGYVAGAPIHEIEGWEMAKALRFIDDGGSTPAPDFAMTAAELAEKEVEWAYAHDGRPECGGTNFEGLFAYSEGKMKDQVFFIKPESPDDTDGTSMRCGKPIPAVEKTVSFGGKYRPWVPTTTPAAEQTAARFSSGRTNGLARAASAPEAVELGQEGGGYAFEQPTSQIKGLYAYTKGAFKGIYFGTYGSLKEMCEPVPTALATSEGACRFPHLRPQSGSEKDGEGAKESAMRFAFTEGVVEDADYQGEGNFEEQIEGVDWFKEETKAKEACCNNPQAKGYWERRLDPDWDRQLDPDGLSSDDRDGYYLLVHKENMHGSCTWSKGRKGRSWNPFKGNDTVRSVKKQVKTEDHVWLPLGKDNQPLLGKDIKDGVERPRSLTGVTEVEQQCGRRLMLQAEPFPRGRELRDALEQFQRAPEKLRPLGARKISFWVLVVGSGLLNVFTIVKRFLDRPEYDPEVPYGWDTSRRHLAMIEMGYVCLWAFWLCVWFPLRQVCAVRRHKYWVPMIQYPPDGKTLVDKGKGEWRRGVTDRVRAEGVIEFTELLQALLSFNLLKGILGIKAYLTRVPKNLANLRHAYPRAKEAKAKKDESHQAGEDGFDDRLEKALTSYYAREFIRDFFDAPLYIGAPLALFVKLAQVSFLGVPPSDWTGNQWLDALSFLNSIMALDHSARVSLETLYDFMFTGETCEHNESNDNAKELYHTVITARLIQDMGYLDTVIALMMPDAKTFQSLLIKEFQLQVQPETDSHEPELPIPGPYKWFAENFALESELMPVVAPGNSSADFDSVRWTTKDERGPLAPKTLAAGPAPKFVGEKFRLEMSAGPHMVNDKIQVTFTGATNEKDWVGIYNKGAEVGKETCRIWQYVDTVGQGTVELTVTKPGQYFLVMLDASSIPQAIEEIGYTERTERLSLEVHGAYQTAAGLISSPLLGAEEDGFAEIPFVDWESMWRDYEPTKARLEEYYRENGDEKFPFKMNRARFKQLVVRGMEQENPFGHFNFTLDLRGSGTALQKLPGWKGVDERKWIVRRTGTDPIWSKPRNQAFTGKLERAKIKPLNKKTCFLAPSSCCLQPAESGLIGVRPKYILDQPDEFDERLHLKGLESHFAWDGDLGQDDKSWDPQGNLKPWQGSFGSAPLDTSGKAVVYWVAEITSNMDKTVWNPGGAAVGIGIPEFASNEAHEQGIYSGNGFFGWDCQSGTGYHDGNGNCQKHVQCEGREWRTFQQWHPAIVASSIQQEVEPENTSTSSSSCPSCCVDVFKVCKDDESSSQLIDREIKRENKQSGLSVKGGPAFLHGQYDIQHFGEHGKPTLIKTKSDDKSTTKTLEDKQRTTIQFITSCPEGTHPDFDGKAAWVFAYTDGIKPERYICGVLAELSNGYGIPVGPDQMDRWQPFETGGKPDLIEKTCALAVVDNAVFRLQPGQLSMRCGSKSQADKERYFKWVVDLPDIYDNSKYQARAYIWGAGVKVTLKEVESGSLFDALKNSNSAMLKRLGLREGRLESEKSDIAESRNKAKPDYEPELESETPPARPSPRAP